jgi:hypothetical protein
MDELTLTLAVLERVLVEVLLAVAVVTGDTPIGAIVRV